MLLTDFEKLRTLEPDPRRVVIVGGGTAGLYLAQALIKQGRQVVVLEAGTTDLGSYPPETYEVVGRRHDGIKIGRSRTLGGTSNLWGGQLVEFQEVDFKKRDYIPGSEWPVTYEEIQPYFWPTYEALGIEPDEQRDEDVWRSQGRECPELTGGLEVFLTRWMPKPNVSDLFGREIEKNPQLIVCLGAVTVGFEGGERIEALRVRNAKGSEVRIEGREFVLAAGTFETVRLLLHAATEEGFSCPWKGNDNVGRGFQDHLGGCVAYVNPKDSKEFHRVYGTIVRPGHKFQPKIRTFSDELERAQRLNIQGRFGFESSFHENLVFLKQFMKAAIFNRKLSGIKDFFSKGFACAKYLPPLMWDYIVQHRIFVPSGAKISLFVQAEQTPNPDSRITIDPSIRDGFGLPKLVLDWKLGGGELESVREFTVLCDEALKAAGHGSLQFEPGLLEGDEKFLDTLRDTNHQTGGAMMGRSAEEGVVDRDLKVFGTENLYVVGASTFRTCSNANVTFTALCFATRLAEHLAKTAAQRPKEAQSA